MQAASNVLGLKAKRFVSRRRLAGLSATSCCNINQIAPIKAFSRTHTVDNHLLSDPGRVWACLPRPALLSLRTATSDEQDMGVASPSHIAFRAKLSESRLQTWRQRLCQSSWGSKSPATTLMPLGSRRVNMKFILSYYHICRHQVKRQRPSTLC